MAKKNMKGAKGPTPHRESLAAPLSGPSLFFPFWALRAALPFLSFRYFFTPPCRSRQPTAFAALPRTGYRLWSAEVGSNFASAADRSSLMTSDGRSSTCHFRAR